VTGFALVVCSRCLIRLGSRLNGVWMVVSNRNFSDLGFFIISSADGHHFFYHFLTLLHLLLGGITYKIPKDVVTGLLVSESTPIGLWRYPVLLVNLHPCPLLTVLRFRIPPGHSTRYRSSAATSLSVGIETWFLASPMTGGAPSASKIPKVVRLRSISSQAPLS